MYIHKDFNPKNIICKSKKSQTLPICHPKSHNACHPELSLPSSQTTPHVSPQNPTTHVIPNFHTTVILNSFQDLTSTRCISSHVVPAFASIHVCHPELSLPSSRTRFGISLPQIHHPLNNQEVPFRSNQITNKKIPTRAR